MRIKIAKKTYDPNEEIIMIHLTQKDKNLIKDMPDGNSVILYCPDNLSVPVEEKDEMGMNFKNECIKSTTEHE